MPASEGWIVVQAVALVLFSSWAFGGVLGWAMHWIFGITLMGLPFVYLRYRESRTVSVRPFLPALLWIVFVGIAMSNPSHMRGENNTWTARADWTAWLPTTVDPNHTLSDGLLWLAVMLQGAALWGLLRTPRAARLLWGAVAINGFALAAVGAFFNFSGATRLLGVVDGPEPGYFFATFFYKNHWAAFGALSTIAAFALALESLPRTLVGDPTARGKTLFFGCAGLLTAVTLPLPGSRAGALLAALIIAGFLGAIIVMAWRTRRGGRRIRHRGLMAAVLLGGGIVAFGATAYAPRAMTDLLRTRQQLSHTLDGDSLDIRIPVSRDTWRMAQRRPWFGWGPGCFEIVFPVFQGAYLRRPDGRLQARFEYAHNDWLQLLAETGIVGAGLFLVSIIWCGSGGWRRGGFAGRWALLGCGVLAAYAWIDFPFHNPSVVVLWVVLLTTAHHLDSPGDDSAFRSRKAA